MKDEFNNRRGMFRTCLNLLLSVLYKPLWFNQPPVAFTPKVAEAETMLGALDTFCLEQESTTTGSTIEKAREAAEAEEAAFELMGALFSWYTDQGDETNAAKVDLSRSQLHDLRDETLKDKLVETVNLGNAVVAASTPACDAYGITAAKVTAVGTEVAQFAGMLAAPQASIAERKAHTLALRARFNAVEKKYKMLDRLVLQFGNTAAGAQMVAAYQAGRVVRDLGAGPGPSPAPTPPPP